jgi:hypothetical protein
MVREPVVEEATLAQSASAVKRATAAEEAGGDTGFRFNSASSATCRRQFRRDLDS